MTKRSKRRRSAQSKNVGQQQHRQPARNGETENSSRELQPQRTVADLQTAAAIPNLFEPMERFMQAAFMPFAWFQPARSALPAAPKLDVIDRDNLVVVRAEVPGVRKSQLEVEASDVYVTIKGTVQHDEEREDEHYRIAETSRGAFERTVHLPSEVDSTKARATFKDGVVQVTLPKLDRSRPHQLKL
jgi:HSP20 family protein